jgi:putative addiction module component (TIGR02574 family)
MNTITEQLIDAAIALPTEERVELVEAVLTSLAPNDRPPFDESWREVIQQRSRELKSGQVIAVPWADIVRPTIGEIAVT